ncbi:MAG: universal stress protein [Chloroflexi bacterium]|nr:universal stress protein [Chloroflexota bacterium]
MEELEAPGRLTHILISLDTSKLSEAVLPIAAQLAKHLDLDVILAMSVPTASDLYVGPAILIHRIDILKKLELEAAEYLKETSEKLSRDQGLRVTWKVLGGDPGTAIVDYAKDNLQNNMIATSTHSGSGIGRWLIGSVTDKVVRSSGDPVLVVRPSSA